MIAAIYARKSTDDSDRNEEARSITRQVDVHRVIHPAEAAVIRRIFTLYGEGKGLTRIAKTLNAEGIPSPRGGTGTWAGTAIRDMLRRSLYAGVLTWNRTQKVTRTGPKARRTRAAAEWLKQPAPELAIVDADLWQRVQARPEATGATFLRRMNGRLIGRPSGADVESPYLLSGIATCAECGGSLVAMTRAHGRQRMPFYGCLRYHKRGVHACRNGSQIRQAALDRAVLDVLAGALDTSVIAEAVTAAVTELSTAQADVATRRASVTAELATIGARRAALARCVGRRGRRSRRYSRAPSRRAGAAGYAHGGARAPRGRGAARPRCAGA